jgi:hypothetical protein
MESMLRRFGASLLAAAAIFAAAAAGADASTPPGRKADTPLGRSGSEVGYLVTVKTATGKGAGTDARVWMKLKGSAAQSGWIELSSRGANLFEPGQLNPFLFWLDDLGTITGVTVWNGSASDSWRLERVGVGVAGKATSLTDLPARRRLSPGANELAAVA